MNISRNEIDEFILPALKSEEKRLARYCQKDFRFAWRKEDNESRLRRLRNFIEKIERGW